MEKTKLIENVRNVIRMKHYSIRTEETYVGWIKRYIFFHNKRHPSEMSENEISEFLSYLAVKKHVAASTHGNMSFRLQNYQKIQDQKKQEGITWLNPHFKKLLRLRFFVLRLSNRVTAILPDTVL